MADSPRKRISLKSEREEDTKMNWISLDMVVYKKSSVIGAVQGMITGLVCITPGAGVVEPWGALLMGAMSGSIPWYTMMVLHRKSIFFQSVDDTLGVFHTHAVAGMLGGILSGILAKSSFLRMMMDEEDLEIGDDAAHAVEAYALWGDGEKLPKVRRRLRMPPRLPSICQQLV